VFSADRWDAWTHHDSFSIRHMAFDNFCGEMPSEVLAVKHGSLLHKGKNGFRGQRGTSDAVLALFLQQLSCTVGLSMQAITRLIRESASLFDMKS